MQAYIVPYNSILGHTRPYSMSRGADVGGLSSTPTDPATTWAVFCTLPMLTLMSSLTSSSPLVSLTTICLFVLSIKVLLTSTSLIYSSSPIITSLSAIAFTKSMYLLMPEWLTARSGVTSLILDFIQQLWQPSGKILDFSPILKSLLEGVKKENVYWRLNKIREKCFSLNFGLNVLKNNCCSAIDLVLHLG